MTTQANRERAGTVKRVVLTPLAALFAFLLAPALIAGEPVQFVVHNLHFDKFDVGGFSAPAVVHAVHQDRRGRIWIGTEAGLFSYDGHGVREFMHNPSHADSLPHSFAKSIVEADDGTIWVGTWGGGLAYLDPAAQRFRRAPVSRVEPADAAFDEKIWSMAIDEKGRLWLGTFSSGLFRYDPDTHELRRVFSAGNPADDRIESLLVDTAGRVWFTGFRGARAVDAETFAPLVELPPEWRNKRFVDLASNDEGVTLATYQSLLFLDGEGKFLKSLVVSSDTSNDAIMEFVKYGPDAFLVGTGGAGLLYVNAATSVVTRIADGKHRGAIESAIIWDMDVTPSGDILVGGTSGVWIAPKASRQFWTVSGFRGSDPIFFTETRAIVRREGLLYLNAAEAIYRFPLPKLPEEPVVVEGQLFATIRGHRPLWMERARDGNFWVGTDRQVFSIDEHDAVVKPHAGLRGAHVLLHDDANDRVQTVTPWGLFELHQDNLPVSAERQQMRFGASPAANKAPQCMDFGAHDDIWSGGFNGIERFDAVTGLSINAFAEDAKKSDWRETYTTFFHINDDTSMLIGTLDGLWQARLNAQGEIARIERFFHEEPFANTAFTAKLETRDGRLLFVNDIGLIEYSPASGDTRLLTVDEGFPSYDIYAAGFQQWDDGIAVLSGNYGPLLFNPDDVRFDNATPRDLLLTDVSSFHGSTPIRWSTEKPLVFRHEDRVIRFKFGLIDYLNPMNDRYSIRLVGFQDEWLDIGSLKEFSFTNLDAGTYRLDVRVTEGLTGKSASLSLPFSVLPPWWLTWWAYALYAFVILGSLFGYWLNLQRKLAREREISARLREADRLKSHFLNELEAKVEDATQDLRHAVEALEIKNVELDAAQQRAVDASRLKSEFLANMSHEIRTPMNGVLGFTQLLAKSDLDNDQRDYVETIEKSAKSLLGIINDVLDVSKIEAGKLMIDSTGFDLRQCVSDTLDTLAPVAYEKNLELIGHVDPALPDGVRSDPIRLRQMITNLVGNGIKFTDSGHVQVHLTKRSDRDGTTWLCIEVTDTGRGITDEDRERLFQAFERGSVSLAGRYTGTGLGLVITKKLCEAMGGRIELESVPGKGTSITVELPLVADRNPENRYGFGKPLAGRKVLVIDPHTQSREALRSRLAHWGAEVVALADLLLPPDTDTDLVVIGIERIRLGDTRGLAALCARLPVTLPRVCLAATVDHEALRSLARTSGAVCVSKAGHLESQLRRMQEALGVPADAPAAHPVAAMRLAGLHVLVADDNRINRYFLKKILEAHGARVTEADCGMAVLRCLDHIQDADIVLLDVHMPDIDGLEVARRIRARGEKRLPLLAVSANVQAETYEAAIAAGINDYLLKPVEETKLVEAVLEWTGREETA